MFMSMFLRLSVFCILHLTHGLALASPKSCAELYSTNSVSSGKLLTTVAALSEINSVRQSRYRDHPDHVDPYFLEIGQTFFITAKALKDTPNLQRKISGTAEARVIDIKTAATGANSKVWKDRRRVIYLDVEGVGRVAVPALYLINNAFKVPNFEQHAPFVAGEYVQIGSNFSSELVVKVESNPDTNFRFSGTSSSYIGKFIRVYNSEHFVIEVQAVKQGVPPSNVIVPKDRVYGLKSGTLSNFKSGVKSLLTIEFDFAVNETVRFRNKEGYIEVGSVRKIGSNKIQIQTKVGLVTIFKRDVFKYVEGEPHTPVYNADWIQAEFGKPKGSLRMFLSGAAKISSLQDYQQMLPSEKIATLMKYLKSNIEWTKGALEAENAGLGNFKKIICSGAGVCRHLAVLMSVILSEAGFSTKVVMYYEEGKNGHAWLEVDVVNSRTNTTFVVDPTNGHFIQPYWQVRKTAVQNPSSNEAKWYVREGREFLLSSDH